jgi:hypothetical protein
MITTYKFKDQEMYNKAIKSLNGAITQKRTPHFDYGAQKKEQSITIQEANETVVEKLFERDLVKGFVKSKGPEPQHGVYSMADSLRQISKGLNAI